jgi:hypothetical protein
MPYFLSIYLLLRYMAACCFHTFVHVACMHAGSAVGVALGTLGLPFVGAAFGHAGLRIALLWDLGNIIASASK